MNKLELQKVIREEVKKALKENSAPVITEAAATIPVSIPGAFIQTFKEFLSEISFISSKHIDNPLFVNTSYRKISRTGIPGIEK